MCNHHDHNSNGVDRRSFIAAGVAGAALVTAAGVTGGLDPPNRVRTHVKIAAISSSRKIGPNPSISKL